MTFDKDPKRWLKDLEDFLKQDEITPPRAISERIVSHARAVLNPPAGQVALKLLALHFVAATLVIMICPQLGVGPLVGGHGLMHFFMHFGAAACAALCGSIFLGTSMILMVALLSREELRVAWRFRFVGISTLVALSFAGLMLLGGSDGQTSDLWWIAGAFIGGMIIFSLGFQLRVSWRVR